MYAVILAGGKIDPGNELFAESKGLPKSMIDIHGKPMIQWVIDAADKAGSVEKLIITGFDSIEGLKSAKPVLLIPDQQGILENLAAATKLIQRESHESEYFLAVSADIPLVTPEIIETVIARSHEPGFDVFYNVVEKNVMAAAFPGVKRTYMRFREGRFCGADMHVMSTKAMEKMIATGFVKYRKRPFKLITMAGVVTILRMLFYPYSLTEAENVVFRKTGIIGKAVVCQTPGMAMDIDTLQHLRIVREKLVQQIANE
jgi:molybdopterin-guanine dinucleotide biosynthesis protein A